MVLHHVGYDEPHYDLMIDLDGVSRLATWRCPHWPAEADDAFTQLSSHRRAYLTYEGAVSGGRGSVTRIAEGFCSIEVMSNDRLRLAVDNAELFLTKTRD
ncbi:MAG: hypothetical protein QM754_14840 [Tepidisphaeraceae bacterium]